MNAKLNRSEVGLPRMPFAGAQLKLSVGADGGGGAPVPQNRVAKPGSGQMQSSVGTEWLAHPKAVQMAQMMRATVGAQGIGGDMVNPQKCLPGYPQEVVNSMSNILCDPQANFPPGVDGATAAYIMSQINLSKYAVAPTRLGWLCDSISFVLGINLATGAQVAINAFTVIPPFVITPTRSFTMDALVLAAGTSNDPLFFITQFAYEGTNFVGTGPWVSTQYKPESGCCLCVRVVPIIQLNTPITIGLVNGNTTNPLICGELYGYTLFSGSP